MIRGSHPLALGRPLADRTCQTEPAAAKVNFSPGLPMHVLEAIQLSKVYGVGAAETRALWLANLQIMRGEFICIVGPSGSGKSTLLSLLGGLERPTAGRVLLEGQDLARMTEDERAILRRRRIGFVFQRMNLLPDFTALENVTLPLTLDKVPSREATVRATEVLHRLGMAHRLDSFPATMSGGSSNGWQLPEPW